ncbi:hypothetical protein B6A10_07625 [Flavobacterium sp. L1I52]|uniref:Uncharacterized protein n=1 Tax=Flavobacterium pokkalii TaxID=1940408 RepID=A0ABR7US06_9FLAO|nr:hypothetical protein [Flavobacterium pokkalii]MBD0725043.1 hypothetical protein [Flavobacterium pokkalii]
MDKVMNEIQLWQGPDGINIPANVNDTNKIVSYANYLTDKQKNQIIAAFQIEAYDMAAEYAWKKAMVKLKETIATLGMKFIGEMLNREDIDEYSTIDTALTDFTTIQLAEQLGVIGTTASLKLKQANELITHYFSKDATEEIDNISAIHIIKSSVQYILGEADISIAIEFSQFRERLLSETLSLKDPQVDQLINSPLFYLRTVMSILLASVKNDKGAKLEHSLSNLNLLIESIWKHLGENDKWNIGTAYRDVTAAGNTIASSGLKNALLKVGGFDFVPENLRSVTFKKAAAAVLETHYAFNNFYNEPSVVRKLASLGSTIPAPALIDCFQAYLAVYLGNGYGVSTIAADIAYEKLSEISKERWYYYFEKVIQDDEIVLSKIFGTRRIERFRNLLISNSYNDFQDLPRDNQQLYESIIENKTLKAQGISQTLYNRIKKK